jgi:hypothetical protein
MKAYGRTDDVEGATNHRHSRNATGITIAAEDSGCHRTGLEPRRVRRWLPLWLAIAPVDKLRVLLENGVVYQKDLALLLRRGRGGANRNGQFRDRVQSKKMLASSVLMRALLDEEGQ